MEKSQKSTAVKMMQLISLVLIIVIVGYSSTVMAQNKSIVLPKGTTVQKIAPGHFKFTLPNRQIVEVKNFKLKLGTTGVISIINPDPPGKPVVTGNTGTFVLSGKLTKETASKLKPMEYIQIDDEVTWLPITIFYQPVNKLSPQPDPPGRQR